MEPIRTTDNNNGYSVYDENHLKNLNTIANKTLRQIEMENPNLLVFPSSLNDTSDRIGDETLFTISDNTLFTSNMMGFVGVNDSQLSISSRFHNNGNDYFLHYMLQKAFSINLLDLKFNTENQNIWDIFLIYIFPYYLKRAIKQGLYKEYVYKKFNDANVKGAIDINRHIKENLHFKGTIAYNTREYAFDNKMTQLIRHTIEYIKIRNFASVLNSNKEIRDAVNLIVQNTPTFNKSNRNKVVHDNKKVLHHPFFTEYRTLQNICLRILRRDGLSYGQKNNNQVYGIVFDGAWLWEEFLNTVLRNLDFIHPENKTGKNAIKLFAKTQNIFPDFYNRELRIVIDAKYKKQGFDNREDFYQLITYMYRLQSQFGILLYPQSSINVSKEWLQMHEDSYGGTESYLIKFGMNIPEQCDSYFNFIKDISSSELLLVKLIKEELIREKVC